MYEQAFHNANKSLKPIVLAVTGHRDIEAGDADILKERLKDIFTNLQQQYKYTPFILLSGLAEGADCIAAKAALECSIRLIAFLPMKVEEYRKTFLDKNYDREFDELLSKAECSYVLEDICNPAKDDLTAPDKEWQYVQLGMYLCRFSHILIALWDGENNGLPGGTAHVVSMKMSGINGPISGCLCQVDTKGQGAVFHILTPRPGRGLAAEGLFSVKKYFIGTDTNFNEGESKFNSILEGIDNFNRDILIAETNF